MMPQLVPPTITLTGGNGCVPLVAHATSPDAGATYHLFVDGATTETPLDQEITGAPYQQLTLVANATFGADTSAISGPTVARVYDPDGPTTSPAVHPVADATTNSAVLSWDADHDRRRSDHRLQRHDRRRCPGTRTGRSSSSRAAPR